MNELKKAIRLFRQSNRAYQAMVEAEDDYYKIDEKLFQQLKKLNQKEFEEYIKYTN